MKCLITADLHYSLRQYDWVLQAAADFDLVILAGDHLDIASLVDGRAQIVVVGKYLERIAAKTRLIICSGNHDLDARDAQGEKTAKWITRFRSSGIPVDGDSFLIGTTLFSVCPWWDGPRAKEQIAAQLARDARSEKGRWIWIYHCPPQGSRISLEASRSFGEAELAQWIGQHEPDFVFCGHAHTAPFTPGGSWIDRVGKTWVFNAGRQIGDVPAHIIFDLSSGQASWFAIGDAQTAHLNEPLPQIMATARDLSPV